ncbi:unnamed protein product, partial [marine sediment metagenome]
SLNKSDAYPPVTSMFKRKTERRKLSGRGN